MGSTVEAIFRWDSNQEGLGSFRNSSTR